MHRRDALTVPAAAGVSRRPVLHRLGIRMLRSPAAKQRLRGRSRSGAFFELTLRAGRTARRLRYGASAASPRSPGGLRNELAGTAPRPGRLGVVVRFVSAFSAPGA